MRLLDGLGFLYNGDGIGGEPRRATATGRPLRHWTLPVTLSGPARFRFSSIMAREPPRRTRLCGCCASISTRASWSSCTATRATRVSTTALLRHVFSTVLEHGFSFVTMQSVAEQLQSAAVAR